MVHVNEVNGKLIAIIEDNTRSADNFRGMSGIGMVITSPEKWEQFKDMAAPALSEDCQIVFPQDCLIDSSESITG